LDYPPEACRQLVAIGVQVLVLAPVPREGDRKKFADAGVLAYLPMTVDADDLMVWVEGALHRTGHGRSPLSDD
ncbi:MAG TPA: hypothetical protein VFK32_03450, partial [Tepidiformaceae bacterium]|nr:hypothetical protein [Tepidiformaceae bacterium]